MKGKEKELFIIYTENRFNQVLIFETWEAAAKWARAATRWTETEIKNQIRKATRTTADAEYITTFAPM